MIKAIDAFSNKELVELINSDRSVVRVVAIVKDGSQWRSFVEISDEKPETKVEEVENVSSSRNRNNRSNKR